MQKLIKLYSFLKENHIKEAELLKKALVSNAHFIITPDNNIFLIIKDPKTGKNVRAGNLWLENKGKVVGNLSDFKYGKNMGYRPGLTQYSFYSNYLIKKDVYTPNIEIEEEFKNIGLGSALYNTALWHCKNKLKFSHMISFGMSNYKNFISKVNAEETNIEFLDFEKKEDKKNFMITKALLNKKNNSEERNTAVLHKQVENKEPIYPVYYLDYKEGYSPKQTIESILPDFKNIKDLEIKHHPELTKEQLKDTNKEDYEFGFEDNYGESFSTPYD